MKVLMSAIVAVLVVSATVSTASANRGGSWQESALNPCGGN